MGVAYAVLAGSWMLAVISFWYSTLDTTISTWSVARGMSRPFAAATLAAAVLRFMVPALASDAGLAPMLLRAASFGVLYVACWLALPGGRAAGMQLVQLARDIRGG
jgi:hypothetical protein